MSTWITDRRKTKNTSNGENIEGIESGNWDLTLFTCTVGGQSRVTIRFELLQDSIIIFETRKIPGQRIFCCPGIRLRIVIIA